jgi:hypothetical protein
MKRVVRDIQKNGREVLRVSLHEYRGHQLISARIWFRNGEVLKPAPKGLSVDVRHLPALREALDEAERLARQEGLPPAVPIRRSVLSWLRAKGTGLCLLADEPLDAYRVLSFCDAIEAEDQAHHHELRRILEHPFKGPIITLCSSAQGRTA